MVLFVVIFSTVIVSASEENEFQFQLPTEPLSATGFNNIQNEFIFCALKAQTQIIDNEGRVIGTENSAFFSGNPFTTFSFIDDSTGTEIDEGGFNVIPEIKCISGGTEIPEAGTNVDDAFGTFAFPSVDIPIRVLPSTLFIKVYSTDANNQIIETYNAELRTKQVDITSANANNLGEHLIGADRIIQYLPDGMYESLQRITVEGTIDLVWRDFPDVVYRYTIETDEQFNSQQMLSAIEADIITFRLINVEKGTNGEEPRGDTPTECEDDEIHVNGFCVRQTQPSSNPNVQQQSALPTNIITDFFNCVTISGVGCFFLDDYIGFTIFGIASLIGIVAISMKTTKQPDIYGLPSGN